MYCKNCGAMLEEGTYMCPTCGEQIIRNNTNIEQGEFRSKSILVFSIIELLCCSPLFGLISLILYFAKLKPAVDSGNIEKAKKDKKTIKILLWLGLIFNISVILICMLIAIPNFSGVKYDMEISADKVTAAEIGKAVMIWSINAKNDPELVSDYEKVDEGFVRLDEIDSFSNYLDVFISPNSYRDEDNNLTKESAYYVTISGEEDDEKVVVAIGPRELNSYNNDANVYKTFYGDTENITTVDYTGYGSGIAYVSY